ncbi:MAG: hypothetical protein U0Z70_21085 [Thermomicrobiales bacterium]
MTVYVESNFVLELALQQEQASAAGAILNSAERGEFRLALPAIALTEPFSTLEQRSRNLRKEIAMLRDRGRDLSRSVSNHAEVHHLEGAQLHLEAISTRDIERLGNTVARILDTAHIITLDSAMFVQAREMQTLFSLSPADSIVLASVLTDLTHSPNSGPHYFVNRNTQDFNVPDVLAELARQNCTFFSSFDDAALVLSAH